ncbi:flagellar biosynthesis anti-sigma factor FlgM [Thiomicrorhabdus aquaedulcis]|uniref:flagellar biosynthesis anti-sigma factor FlgM n=1 Tax=Thiomicrorhabdus aquaedulcis TaxID=2211106 RepID=UPI000FDC4266|nr:flagellar biosynthesis anti-sigma factor FlgM [Thiomicrorhabdus aquaedulcis]
MDIKNVNSSPLSSRSAEQTKAADKDGMANAQGSINLGLTANTDKVTLTNTLSQVRDLEQKAQSVNIDNSERILALKAAIQDGSYQVNPEKIADKLMQTEALFARL